MDQRQSWPELLRPTLARRPHQKEHPSLNLSVEDVLSEALRPSDLVSFIQKHRGDEPLIYSSEHPERVAASQEKAWPEKVRIRLRVSVRPDGAANWSMSACDACGRGR